MDIIWTILLGFIVGLVAKMLMPGKDPKGFFVTAIIGIAGAFIAKYLGMALHFYNPEDAAGFVMSVLGAMLLLYAYHKASTKTV